MTATEKVKLYERLLNEIACWGEATLSRCDEPGGANAARDALITTDAKLFIKRYVVAVRKYEYEEIARETGLEVWKAE